MFIDFMLKVFDENKDRDAVVWKDKSYSYQWLVDQIHENQAEIKSQNIKPGAVTIIEADFSPSSIALFIALLGNGSVVVPITESVGAQRTEFIQIAQGEVIFNIDREDHVTIRRLPHTANHQFYQTLRKNGHPGLVLFSSGSTGKSKASVHDMTDLLEKFKIPRHSRRAITFLLYDHIGGVNTMLYTLSNGGCIITVQDRSPDGVLGAVEKHKAELLPTSPTFINLILLSEAYKRHDISTLKTVTYGTEPMPESTLKRFHQLFPHIRLQQTYGLSEVGILRSKSKSSDSLWVKVGGEGFQTRVVNGILQIKARSSMLGYLNAPSPFAKDGWFDTGDYVEVDGEYIKILGRKSEIINVGGEKVYPAEVESVVRELDGVSDVTVYGEKNPITGQIVCAKITPSKEVDHKKFVAELKKHCRKRLQNYKVPVKVAFSEEKQYSDRFKKVRPR
ncbi:MAG: long-chain fatty acid--CoA ligase [candidate division Zixibacteria bacterium]|nr:long-chain fatty acid--CoA ligase [candidate division Zixibacteria bacterium]